jgi:hypothetical protein
MYTPKQIFKGIQDPHFAALHLNRLFADKFLTKFRPRTDFLKQDWDNLLILDACRYDMMKDIDLGDGVLDYRWSPGSHSTEFVEFHTDAQPLDDIVWVTANPWVSKHREKIFKVIDLWDSSWDDKLQTVLPEAMREVALEAEGEYPNKRLIIHFMQPHYPFIGEFGQTVLPNQGTFTGDGMIKTHTESDHIWNQLQAGTVSKGEVWKGYTENLNIVFPIAQHLCNNLSGRTVITADHGNELGKRAIPVPIRIYGHPYGLRTKNLVKVPWVVFEGKERKTITSGTVRSDTTNEEVIKERLRALGYHE